MKKVKKNVKRLVKDIGIILLSILIILLLLFILNFIRINITYLINKSDYEERIEIYGVKDSYVPQGLTYVANNELILETAYNGKKGCSQLYVIDFDSGNLLSTLDLYEGEECTTGHVGGITVVEDKVIITYDYNVLVYRLDEVLNGDGYVNNINKFEISNRGDFCYYSPEEEMLWIGEFYLRPFYDLPDGEPFLYGYDLRYLGDSKKLEYPNVVIKLPKMVQGMLVTDDGEFVFSRSFTYLINSKLTTYRVDYRNGEGKTKEIEGRHPPYYELNDNNKISEQSLPPMSEGMFYRDGKAYILFESNSSYYKLASPKIKKLIELKIK